MNLIEQATRRLEELERAGVAVPWDAARFSAQPGGANAAGGAAVQPLATSGVTTLPLRAAPVADVFTTAPRYAPAPPARSVQLDLARLAANGYLVPDQIRSEMAEQFRHIKRPLLKNMRQRDGDRRVPNNHLMITSALPGEGKTFSSINMAMSMAMEVDTAVILVDADVIRPSVFNRLGLDASIDAPTGLLDYLSGRETDLGQLLVGTNVPKLMLMSTGPGSNQSSELLASASMDRLLEQLSEQYADHVVIFDAPPLLLTTESTVLAGKAGQVLVVVESGKTPKSVVKQAFDTLRHCASVSAMLNKCMEPTEGRRYGYYYG